MSEAWLKSNRRVLSLALVLAGALALVGLALALRTQSTALRAVAVALLAVGSVMSIGLVGQILRPRIAYRDGEVLFYLRAGQPVAVPLEVVEAFFIGQGPAFLPLAHEGGASKTVNLVARLSQKHPEWAHAPVKPALGHWCESYVTIRGTWCEPLDGEVIRRLNRRLHELQRQQRGNHAEDPDRTPLEDESNAP